MKKRIANKRNAGCWLPAAHHFQMKSTKYFIIRSVVVGRHSSQHRPTHTHTHSIQHTLMHIAHRTCQAERNKGSVDCCFVRRLKCLTSIRSAEKRIHQIRFSFFEIVRCASVRFFVEKDFGSCCCVRNKRSPISLRSNSICEPAITFSPIPPRGMASRARLTVPVPSSPNCHGSFSTN